MTILQIQSKDAPTKIAEQVIAIASSRGGIKALQQVLGNLPADFIGSIVIVQHLSALFKSNLANVLDRHTTLQVKEATEGAKLLSGIVYVAPPDDHVIINHDGNISLSHAPKKHFVRPSAEYTFKSLADSYQSRAIAVVLTGYDGDGKEGVRLIKAKGGKVIAQDEATSVTFDMPESAIQTGCVDLILPLNQIADGIISMVNKRP